MSWKNWSYWEKFGFIGLIIYPIVNYGLGILYFFLCLGWNKSLICKVPYYSYDLFFSYPSKLSWLIVTGFGLQSSLHPLYNWNGIIGIIIQISTGIFIGFIIGAIIGLIYGKFRNV